MSDKRGRSDLLRRHGARMEGPELEKVTIRLPERYIRALDFLVKVDDFPSRSEAIRAAIRDFIYERVDIGLHTTPHPDDAFHDSIAVSNASQIDAEAILPSPLTPVREGGGISSHSHCLDMIEAFSFVSAWDLYQISLAEASSIIVIGSSEDPENCLRSCVCACECVRVCASPVEDEQQTASSMIVPREGSQ